MSAPIADTTNATHPFNKTAADAILRSADNVDFWVRRSILAEASCIFEDMLSLPQPPPGSPNRDEYKDGLPVIRVAEDSTTLDKLLRLCYPTDDPEFHSLDQLRPVLEASLKYMMQEATSLLRRRLVKLGQAQPLRTFAIACTFNLQKEADTLAPLAYSVHGTFVEELHDISAGVYYRVSHYVPRSTPGWTTSCKPRARRNSPASSPIFAPQRSFTTGSPEHYSNFVEHIPPELLNSPTADIIIRSSDGVEFRLHSAILSLASKIFQRMIAEHGDHTQPGGIQTVALPEDSCILATLFQHTYPLARPEPPSSFCTLKALLLTAEKYALTSALSALCALLPAFIPSPSEDKHTSPGQKDALRVFALAHRLGLPTTRAAAARALLRLSRDDLRNHYAPELEDISAAAYFRLLEYHDRCGHAAAAHILAHALSYSSSGATASAPSSPSPAPTSASSSRRSSPDNPSPNSPPPTSPRSPSHSPAPASAPPPALTARRSHGPGCHVVLDDTSDRTWGRFRTQSTPRWWVMYVYKVGVVLRGRPGARVALDAGLRQRAIARAAECACCRAHFLPGFVEYAEGLAREVERVVMKVKLEID